MKIEMVVPSLPAAGMEVMVCNLRQGLAAGGHDVGITCLETRGLLGDKLAGAGVRVSVVPDRGWASLLYPSALTAHFRSLRPDVVHIHSGALAKAARAARLARVNRVVYTMHGVQEVGAWHGAWLERLFARQVTRLVAVSETMRTNWQAGSAEQRVEVIPNGIDTDVFRPGPRSLHVRERFGLGPDDIVIGHVARFTPVKNQALLLQAFAQVLREEPGAFLALVGDGPLRADLEQQAARLGIRDRVGFFGMTFESAGVYRDFDVFALSSHLEQTSMSILEAMATGLPVVATAVGGTPHLLATGQAGLLVPAGDAVALAGALLELVRNPEQRSTLGQRARQRVVAHYGMDVMIERYEAVYADGAGRALSAAV